MPRPALLYKGGAGADHEVSGTAGERGGFAS